jgi:excisionase family DNA binding protein
MIGVRTRICGCRIKSVGAHYVHRGCLPPCTLPTSDIADTVSNQDPDAYFLDEVDRRLISVTEAAQVSGLTPSYLRRLLRTGRLAGVKVGRDWFTTTEAIRAYLALERRPGPKIT